jgi:hypothetical protein
MPFASRSRRLVAVGLGLVLGVGGAARAGDIFCGHHKDTRGVGRAIGGPVYVPTNAPAPQTMGVVPVPIPPARDTAIERAMEAEHHAIQAEAARAAFRAEVEGKQRLLQRLGASYTTQPGTTPADVDSQLRAITDKLDRLATRLTDVERLLLVHDNYLQEMYKTWPPGAPLPPHAHEPVPPPKILAPPPDKKDIERKPVTLPLPTTPVSPRGP